MFDYSGLVLYAIFIPLIVALASLFVAKIPKIGANIAKGSCIITLLIILVILLILVPAVETNPIQTEFFSFMMINATATIGIYVDLLSLLPAILCTFIAILVLVYTISYISPKNNAYCASSDFNRIYPLSLLLVSSIIGALFSSNMIGLLFFWELISLSLFGLISFWYKERDSVKAAFKCFIMTHIGSLALFVATIVLYSETGTLSILEYQTALVPTGLATLIILSLTLVALLPKAAQMPFHTWLPDSTTAPTPAVLLILASDSAGIYLLIRFFTQTFRPVMEQLPFVPFPGFFGNINIWSFILSTIGIITLVSAAANALTETNLKRILGYSVISELGFCVMVTGFASAMGVTSGLFYLSSHLLVAGLLFLCIGSVIYMTGKTDINQIGGLYKYMPLTTILTAISVLAIGGLPMLSEFIGKYLIIQSTFDLGSPFFLAATMLGGVFHLAISVRLLYSVFLDKDKHACISSSLSDPPLTMLLPMVILASGIVILGVVPNLLLDSIILPAIGQIGFQANLVEPLVILSTSLGHWTPLVISVAILTSVAALSIFVTRFTKKKKRDPSNADAFKPFLCGEDPENRYDLQSGLYYDSVIQNLRLDEAKRASDVDRFYNFLIKQFTKLCNSVSKFDIEQKFSFAFLSFFIATVVLLIIVIFVV